jgi:hypothetical protein
MAATTATIAFRPAEDARRFAWDMLFVTLALLHGLLLIALPIVPVIALGVWWNSNTIAHSFLHRPFFRARSANRIFAAFLTVLLGIPQTLWRDRHLAHHADREWRLRITPALVFESALVLALWLVLALQRPRLFLFAYLPGYALGLVLCALQGRYEHLGGVTSHYGKVYNFLAFNDGFHAEHHASPGLHWTCLPDRRAAAVRTSNWPPLLRWIDGLAPTNHALELLERLALRFPALQRFLLRTHRDAFRALLADSAPSRIVLIGGGLFPRTAIVLRDLLPSAQIAIVDSDARNLATARSFLESRVSEFEFIHGSYSPDTCAGAGLAVFPLCFTGDREALYRNPPAPSVLIHDWAWRCRGRGALVSRVLFKRLNLVTRCAP